jgi:S1 RNA binding domain protein
MSAEGDGTVDTGQIVEGVVARITNYGAFVDLPSGRSGLVHISEIADTFIRDIREYLREGQRVRVKVLGLNERGKLDLSVKQALTPEERANRHKQRTTFEEKLKAFLKQSEERQLDVKRNTEAKRGGRTRRHR